MKAALEKYNPGNNRSQVIRTEKNLVVMDAYNANPTSMAAALENFSHYDAPRKAVVLGDMLELGDVSAEEHQKIVLQLQQMRLEYIFLVGPQFASQSCGSNFKTFDLSSELADFLTHSPIEDCVVLIKGSRGIKLETILEKL